MSASTRTIQQPAGRGSLLGAVAMGVAAVLAVGAIAWGALNLTATKHVATPVAAPIVLDKGSRDEIAPQAAPAPYTYSKPGNVTPRFDTSGDNNGLNGYWNQIAPQAAPATHPQVAPATHPHGRPAYETPRVDPNADNGDVVTHGAGSRAS
jgi:hypothetical protein